MDDREELSALCLSHLKPPSFSGGSWTLNPDALADAILSAGFIRATLAHEDWCHWGMGCCGCKCDAVPFGTDDPSIGVVGRLHS